MLNIRLSQDLCAALLFALLGAAALWFGADLDPGTSAEMGPGYMPRALGWMILLVAAVLAGRALVERGPKFGRINLRPMLCILGGVLLFGLTVESIGFVLASMIGVFVAVFAMARPTPLYVVTMTLALPAAMSAVFVLALGLPFDLWWF